MKLHIARATSGAQWMREGIRVFWRQPIALTGLFFMFLGLMTLISVLPVIGGALALVLFPTGSLGLMVATREAVQGRFPRPKLLLIGWLGTAAVRRQMLGLGVAYALGFVAILGVSMLADGGEFARLYLLGGKLDADTIELPVFQSAVWTALLLYLPLSALFWHAPALVYWHGVPAVKSLFFSLTACVANWKALTVYMLSWTALYAGVGLALMVAGSLVGGSEGVGMAVVPIMLMFTAMFFCSVYFTYRDSFEPAGSGPDPL